VALGLTPALIEATYERWRSVQPFKSWGLPAPDAIGFQVTGHVDRYGHYDDGKPQGRTPHIAVSAKHVKDLPTLDAVIAHELCHMRQEQLGGEKDDHGRKFKRAAAAVLKRHRWLDKDSF
jgi:hypothetical protein